MANRRRSRLWRACGLAVLFALPATGRAAAQNVSAVELKAAFLYNFVKFAEWPTDALAPQAPLNLCVVDKLDVAEALSRLVDGQLAGQRRLSVLAIGADASSRACHLLYVEHLDSRRTTRLLDSVKGVPILTVADSPGFAPAGGVAEFFVEGGKMRFAVNMDAAQRARLQLSSRLLSLAKIVRDDHRAQ